MEACEQSVELVVQEVAHVASARVVQHDRFVPVVGLVTVRVLALRPVPREKDDGDVLLPCRGRELRESLLERGRRRGVVDQQAHVLRRNAVSGAREQIIDAAGVVRRTLEVRDGVVRVLSDTDDERESSLSCRFDGSAREALAGRLGDGRPRGRRLRLRLPVSASGQRRHCRSDEQCRTEHAHQRLLAEGTGVGNPRAAGKSPVSIGVGRRIAT